MELKSAWVWPIALPIVKVYVVSFKVIQHPQSKKKKDAEKGGLKYYYVKEI